MRKRLTYYKVQVKRLKYRDTDRMLPDDAVFMNEGDTVCGYVKHSPEVGKYMDLWFSSYLDAEERDNYITLGRVTRIENAKSGNGKFLVTKLGRFIVEEVTNGIEMENHNHLQ